MLTKKTDMNFYVLIWVYLLKEWETDNMEIIIQNPFRVLGISVTASDREIAKRISDLSIYMEMGKTKEYDTDFYFPEKPKRTIETVQDAAQKIELPNNKLFYALFWFHENSFNTIDEMAFEELKNGNVEKTIQFWGKATINDITAKNKSNHRNLSILHLGLSFSNHKFRKSHFLKSLDLSSDFFTTNSFNDFAREILGVKHSVDYLKVMNSYVDEIISQVEPYIFKDSGLTINELINHFSTYPDKISTKVLEKYTAKHIYKINNAISKFDEKSNNNKSKTGEYGVDLLKTVNKDVESLKEIFSDNTLRYQPIFDKLANKLIDAAVAAWNENDVRKNDKVHNQIKTLQKEITSIAIGSAIIDRYEEQLGTINKFLEEKENIDKLLPLLKKLNQAVEKSKSVKTSEIYHIAKQFVFDIKNELDKIKNSCIVNARGDDSQWAEKAIVNCALFVQDCSISIANNNLQYGKAVELIDMSRRILLCESNGITYSINRELTDVLISGRHLLSDNITNTGGLMSLAIGGGIRMIKHNTFCGCGSGKNLKECCSV